MPTHKELLFAAQNSENTTLAGRRVTVLKSLDELGSFNGEDDYKVNLPIIVGAYPDGISQAKVREVLPDALKLAKAVKELKNKEIEVVEISPRNILFKTLKKEPAQPPQREVVEVNTNPTGNPVYETQAPAASKNPASEVIDVTDEDARG